MTITISQLIQELTANKTIKQANIPIAQKTKLQTILKNSALATKRRNATPGQLHSDAPFKQTAKLVKQIIG